MSWGQAEKMLTIEDAKKLFIEFGNAFYSEETNILDIINKDAVIQNSNYLHALYLTQEMFKRTKHSLCMLTGKGVDGFLSCLEKAFIEMLERITGIVRIIAIDENSNNTLKELSQKYPEKLEVIWATASPDAKINHYIVADKGMIRKEENHKPLEDSDLANVIHAEVCFDNQAKASVLRDSFDSTWTYLKKS